MIRKFNRFEIKYILRADEYLRILPHLEKNMEPDQNGNESGFYMISSLYYDRDDLIFYNDKKEGFKYRRKLRLRVYPDSDKDLGFVEIKQRINRTVQKRRIILPYSSAADFCTGSVESSGNLDKVDTETGEEIRFLVNSLKLRPSCVITYQRRAFEGHRFDSGVRVTFDFNLRYRRGNFDPRIKAGSRPFLSRDLCIMEVKINEKVPVWLASLVSGLQCTLMRVSKYCCGIEADIKNSSKRIQLY